ncbi:MAG: hypothetical protein HQM08_17505 [Candidatus Riflebacteria bacterium]|nr:hypothetical protein [Candidatus Riflebacteria bacterium]
MGKKTLILVILAIFFLLSPIEGLEMERTTSVLKLAIPPSEVLSRVSPPEFLIVIENLIHFEADFASDSSKVSEVFCRDLQKEISHWFSTIEKNFTSSFSTLDKKYLGKSASESLIVESNKLLEVNLYSSIQKDFPKLLKDFTLNFAEKNHVLKEISVNPYVFINNVPLSLSQPNPDEKKEKAFFYPASQSSPESSLNSIPRFTLEKPTIPSDTYVFRFFLPLFTKEFIFLREPDGMEFSLDVALPAALDENLHSKIYQQILNKLETLREQLQKNLEKTDITFEEAWKSNRLDESFLKAQLDIVKNAQKQFTKDASDAVEDIIKSFSGNFKKVNGKMPEFGILKIGTEIPKIQEEFNFDLFIPPPRKKPQPDDLEKILHCLEVLKIPELYNDLRKIHTQTSGGIAVSTSMLRDIIRPERNSKNAFDLFNRKQVSSFYQAAAKTFQTQDHRLEETIYSIKNLICKMKLVALSYQKSDETNDGEKIAERLKSLTNELALFQKYCILYKQGIENLLVIEKTAKKFFPSDSPNQFSEASFKSVFNVLSGVLINEMGDSKGNSPEYIKRMNIFQPKNFNDAKTKFTEVIEKE